MIGEKPNIYRIDRSDLFDKTRRFISEISSSNAQLDRLNTIEEIIHLDSEGSDPECPEIVMPWITDRKRSIVLGVEDPNTTAIISAIDEPMMLNK
jgi:hypothetical protein